MMIHSVSITVIGHVQGVGFRYHTLREAELLEIRGFVNNQPDGSVYIEAEGESEKLEVFVQWCRKGPPHARVLLAEVKRIEVRNYEKFQIE